MKDLALFAEESSLFAAPHLAEALDVPLYVMLPQYNNLMGNGRQGIPWQEGRAIRESNIIIIGYTALTALMPRISAGRYRSIAVIFSDSLCAKYCNEWNILTHHHRITVYIMPDLAQYSRGKYIPAYQTINIQNINTNKAKEGLIIAHSPRDNSKVIAKGSLAITRTINDLKKKHDFEYISITKKPYHACLHIKSQAHIFIDQLINGNPEVPQERWGRRQLKYKGGLGKSGIEAMLMGCCVITGGEEPDTNDYFPSPPVVWTSYEYFSMDLERLIEDPDYRIKKAEDQKEWAEKYTSAEFVAKHVTQHLR